MENIIAIGAGVALRVVLDIATSNDHRLIGLFSTSRSLFLTYLPTTKVY